MIKKLISGFLAAVMLMSSMPLGVLAEAVVYEKHFVIEPESKLSEKPFRQWAAELVKAYRNEYACVNKSGEFLQSAYDLYKGSSTSFLGNDFEWETYSSLMDDALYHPYYALAEAKEKYNLSKDANAQHDGEVIKSTEYTLLDEQELKGLYLWMIKETIMEKAQMDPGFFEQEVEGNQRLYSFSVSEGTLVMDSMLENLEQSTVKQAWADVGETAVSALEVAIEAAIAWDQLKQKAKGVVENAKTEAAGKTDMTKFVNSLKKNALSELGNALTDTLDTAVKKTSENYQNSIQNIMRAELTSELLDNMMDCNINIVNYLRTTYVETPVYLLDKDFAATVDSVIDVLESPAFEMAMISSAEKRVTADLVNSMMKSAGIELNEILTADEISKILGKEIIVNLGEGIISFLKSTAQDGLEMLAKEWKNNGGERSKQLIDTIEECVNKIITEGLDRLKDLVKEAGEIWEEMDSWSESTEVKIRDTTEMQLRLDTELNRKINEQFYGLNNKKTPYIEMINSTFIDAGISAAVSLLGIKREETEVKEIDKKSLMNIRNQIKKQEKFTEKTNIIVELGLDKNDAIARVVIDTGLVMFKALNASMKDSIKAYGQGISDSSKAKLNSAIDNMDKIIDEYEMTISNNKSPMDMADMLDSLLQLLADLIDLAISLDDQEWDIIWQAIVEHETFSVDTLLDAMEAAFKDDNLKDMLLQIMFGGSIKDVGDSIKETKKNGGFESAYWEKKANQIYTKLNNTVNATVEGTMEIVGSVWDSMMDCSADLAKAANSIGANLSGEHSASLNAERARQTYEQSKKLEAQNVLFTRGGRAAAYMNYGIKDYETFLDIWNNDPSEKQNRYLMDDVDILYHDLIGNWVLTPDVDTIRVLTDYILTQMHLDAVGMGAYVTVVKNMEEFEGSRLYRLYLNKDVLLTERETERRYNKIVEMLREIESAKPTLN